MQDVPAECRCASLARTLATGLRDLIAVKAAAELSGMMLRQPEGRTMKTLALCLALTAFVAASPASHADDVAQLTFAGDQYAAGKITNIEAPVERDAFAVGNDVTLATTVSGDAHLAGYDVNVGSDVTGDLYAAGFAVNVTGAVGGDLTVLGNAVNIRSAGTVGGNARLAGSSVILAAPVAGSAIVTAHSLTLDTAIAGDFSFYGENLTFGPGARVDGKIEIRAPDAVSVPTSVAPAERVSFEVLDAPDYVSEAGKTAGDVVGRFWPVFWTVVVFWLGLLIIGAGLIALLPGAVAALQSAAERRPFRNLGLGILAFAAVLGLVPVVAMTVVGLLLVPVLLVFAVVASGLAYLVGAFIVGLRVATAFVATNTNIRRLIVLAVSLLAAALLGMIPLVGWFITLGLVIFGFGTATLVMLTRWSGKSARRPSSTRTASGAVA